MNKLHKELELMSISGTKYFKVIKNTFFYSSIAGIISIKKGQLTDLATIPWFARWLYSRSGPHKDAAIIHDTMLSQGYTRTLSDLVFREALQDSNVSALHVSILYSFVKFYTLFCKKKARLHDGQKAVETRKHLL